MTPGARLQSAIDLLQAVDAGSAAADRIVAAWFRARRYAGAKDRAAISELVYGVLRRRAELTWRIERSGAAANPRLLVLAASAAVPLIADGPHGAAPLSADEKEVLDRAAAIAVADVPDWVRANVPEWLVPALRSRFSAAFDAECAALNQRAPVDLRVNTLKSSRDAVLKTLSAAGIDAQPTLYAPHGIRLNERPRLDQLRLEGLVEPQDEAAQLAALLVDARPGMTVVDLCAGAGGKTLALAAAMENRGRILALDRGAARLARLGLRAGRAGVTIVQTQAADDSWFTMNAGIADRVLIDAPCSGAGTWRRNPEARWRLNAESLVRHKDNQRALLRQGAALVRPGGRLVYATCSLLPEENEAPVEQFLEKDGNFALVPMRDLLKVPAAEDHLMLTPHRHGTDGFFVAVLSRRS